MLPGSSPFSSHYMEASCDITSHRAGSPRIDAMQGHPSNVTTSLLNQLGLGGTSHCSMGVAGHMKPHRVTDVNTIMAAMFEQGRYGYMKTIRVRSHYMAHKAASFSLKLR